MWAGFEPGSVAWQASVRLSCSNIEATKSCWKLSLFFSLVQKKLFQLFPKTYLQNSRQTIELVWKCSTQLLFGQSYELFRSCLRRRWHIKGIDKKRGKKWQSFFQCKSKLRLRVMRWGGHLRMAGVNCLVSFVLGE